MTKHHTVPRVLPAPDKLRELSEHVAYEVKMVIGTATKLLGDRTKDWIDIRAQAESFMLHARQLQHFFHRTPRRDIPSYQAPPLFAVDYVPDWETRQPKESQVLKTLAGDVGKRVAHLTTERIVGQEYPVLEAARALLEVIRAFRDAAPPTFVADLGSLAPPWDANAGFVYGTEAVFSTSSPPERSVFVRVPDAPPTAPARPQPARPRGRG